LRLLAVGVIGFGLNQFGFLGGLSLTDASSAALVFAAAPVLTAVLAAWRYGEPLTRWAGLGLLMATVGVVLVIGPHGLSTAGSGKKLLGDLLICATVVTVVFAALGVKQPLRRNSALRVTTWSCVAGAAVLMLAGAPTLTSFAWGSLGPAEWAIVAFVTLGATVGTNLLWNYGIHALGATRVMAYSLLEPVVAVVTAAAWLGEHLAVPQMLGAGVILAGLVLHTLTGRPIPVASEAEPAVGTETTFMAEEAAAETRQTSAGGEPARWN
jgi:drug/metabolite transporter (DMT)-like permease